MDVRNFLWFHFFVSLLMIRVDGTIDITFEPSTAKFWAGSNAVITCKFLTSTKPTVNSYAFTSDTSSDPSSVVDDSFPDSGYPVRNVML